MLFTYLILSLSFVLVNQPRKGFHFCQCWKGSSGCWTFLCSLLLTVKLSYTNVPFSNICNLSYFSFCSNEWLLITTIKNPCMILTSDQQSHSFQVKIFSTEEAMIFSWEERMLSALFIPWLVVQFIPLSGFQIL